MDSAFVATLDVRPLPPRDRHPRIHQTLAALQPGAAVLLINDHDPKPLYYELQAEHPGAFEWTYLQSGPEVWRVGIRKVPPT